MSCSWAAARKASSSQRILTLPLSALSLQPESTLIPERSFVLRTYVVSVNVCVDIRPKAESEAAIATLLPDFRYYLQIPLRHVPRHGGLLVHPCLWPHGLSRRISGRQVSETGQPQ